MFQLLYEPEISNRVWGMIGPNDNPGVANFVAPISANSGLLTVSKIYIMKGIVYCYTTVVLESIYI